jgi:hypothetical protein
MEEAPHDVAVRNELRLRQSLGQAAVEVIVIGLIVNRGIVQQDL